MNKIWHKMRRVYIATVLLTYPFFIAAVIFFGLIAFIVFCDVI